MKNRGGEMQTERSAPAIPPAGGAPAPDLCLDLTGIRAEEIGPSHGLSPVDWERAGPDLERVADEMRRMRIDGVLEPLERTPRLPGIERLRAIADHCRSFDGFVAVAPGGPAASARLFHDLRFPELMNLLPVSRRGGPRLFVSDGLDPDRFEMLLETAPPGDTVYHVIGDADPPADLVIRMRILVQKLREARPDRWRDHLVISTPPGDGVLSRFAREHGITHLATGPREEGCFSVLGSAGLLSAAVAGIPPEEILAGAERFDARCRERRPIENPALALAGILWMMDRAKGKPNAAVWSFAEALSGFGAWVSRLWSESFGKRRTPQGEARSPVGGLAIDSIGPRDRETLLQRLLHGPSDFWIVQVRVGRPAFRSAVPAAGDVRIEGSEHLDGRRIDEVVALEASGMEMLLRDEARPLVGIELPDFSGGSIGQLCQLFQWTTIAAAMLYHVDPFDRPAVAEGRRLAHAAAGRPDLENLRNQIETHRADPGRYRI
ncbi:MAG: hypothetical protein GF346_02880 [Candidatus Eisenbacteria bacterium]|nr:hypothetical protein [Candidatus Latescibacterota bacterium]MBD3301365.1 hypothetical protein [Candidatus Eisenbacteria bacterium]